MSVEDASENPNDKNMLSARVEPELKRRLKGVCGNTGIGMADAVGEAVAAWLDQWGVDPLNPLKMVRVKGLAIKCEGDYTFDAKHLAVLRQVDAVLSQTQAASQVLRHFAMSSWRLRTLGVLMIMRSQPRFNGYEQKHLPRVISQSQWQKHLEKRAKAARLTEKLRQLEAKLGLLELRAELEALQAQVAREQHEYHLEFLKGSVLEQALQRDA